MREGDVEKNRESDMEGRLPRCEWCIFWNKDESKKTGDGIWYWFAPCKRYPPMIINGGNFNPEVRMDDWCGEFKDGAQSPLHG